MKRTDLIPIDKFDIKKVKELKKLSDEEIQPILPELFAWIEDINWPVAKELVKVLPIFNEAILPYVKDLWQNPDGLREYSIYYCMLPRLNIRQLELLSNELQRIAYKPTDFEQQEEYDKIVLKYLDKINRK
jgi:hypothetical protein